MEGELLEAFAKQLNSGKPWVTKDGREFKLVTIHTCWDGTETESSAFCSCGDYGRFDSRIVLVGSK